LFSIEPQQWHELISTCVDKNQNIERYYDNLFELSSKAVERSLTPSLVTEPNLDQQIQKQVSDAMN
jgi:hypothetical protein